MLVVQSIPNSFIHHTFKPQTHKKPTTLLDIFDPSNKFLCLNIILQLWHLPIFVTWMSTNNFFNMTYDMCLNSYVHYLQNFLVTLTNFYKTFQKDKNNYTFTCTTKLPKHRMQLNTSNNIYFQKPIFIKHSKKTKIITHSLAQLNSQKTTSNLTHQTTYIFKNLSKLQFSLTPTLSLIYEK